MGPIGVHQTATSDGAWDGPAAKANLKNDGTREYYRKQGFELAELYMVKVIGNL